MSKKISSSTTAAKDAFEAAALGRPLHALFAFRIPTTRTHHKRSAKGLARDLEGKANILEEYLNHPAGILKQLEDDEDYERWTKGERRQIRRILRHADVIAGRIAFRDMGAWSRGEQAPAMEELKWRTAHDDRINFHFRQRGDRHNPLTVVKMDDGYTYVVFQIEKRDIESRGKWPAVAGGAGAVAVAADADESEAEAEESEEDAPQVAAAAAAAAPSLADRVAALEAENIAFRAQLEALRAEMAYIKHKKHT
jgi:hypothetical protein